MRKGGAFFSLNKWEENMNRREASVLKETAAESPVKSKLWSHPGGKLIVEGSCALRQDELLAILIGSGIPGHPAISIANTILDEYVGLYGIHRNASLESLSNFRGLGVRKASRIMAAIEIGRRLHLQMNTNQKPIEEQRDLFGQCGPMQDGELGSDTNKEERLLATVIGSGVPGKSANAIAKELIHEFGSIMGLFGRDLGEFLKIKGLDSVKTIRIAAALEVAKRIEHALS